jgi:hypothetical protein
MASVGTQPNFDLRIYDGTAVTPFFVQATFLDPPTLPVLPPRPETTVIIGGGRAETGNIASVIADESPIFQPLPFSLRIALQSERLGVLDALGNPRGLATWTVGSDTWTPVATADIGTRNNSSGTAVVLPGPKDQDQIDGMYNIVALNSVPGDAPLGVVFATELKGCVTITVDQVVEAPQVFLAVSGVCYGAIDSQITAFPTGTESTLPT